MEEKKIYNTSQSQNLDPEKPMISISTVADILKVHPRTLRIYDEENLLSPQRTMKNRRLYSLNDIERGKFVQYLSRELGINLMGIKIIINLLQQQKISLAKYIEYMDKAAHELKILI